MSDRVTVNGGGVSTLGLLGIVLVVLKVLGHIDWPWWLVLAPFWVGFILVILILLIALAAIYIAERY